METEKRAILKKLNFPHTTIASPPKMSEIDSTFSSCLDTTYTSFGSLDLSCWDEYEEDTSIVAIWPQDKQRYSKPPTQSLIKMYMPPVQKPEPISQMHLDSYQQFMESVEKQTDVLEKKEEKRDRLARDLEKVEEELKEMHRWKDATSKKQLQRKLIEQIEEAEKDIKDAKKTLDAVIESGETLETLFFLHKKKQELYEENQKLRSHAFVPQTMK